MGRIIPWGLPEIFGGSVGGYTPVDPTPDPTPKEPFDLTSMVATFPSFNFSLEDKNGTTYKLGIKPVLNVSGQIPVDTSEVTSIKVYVATTSGTASWTDDGGSHTMSISAQTVSMTLPNAFLTPFKNGEECSYTINGIKSSSTFTLNGGLRDKAFTGTFSLVGIELFDADGNVIQTTVPEEE